MFIRRKELLDFMKEQKIAERIKHGPVALFYVPEKCVSSKEKKAKTISISLHKCFVITKYNNFIIPLHIYKLSEILV